MSAEYPFSDVEDEPLLNIKAVSHATGIESVTLRAWERRYGVPMPNRTTQGYRLYSKRDVAILNWLKARIEEGLTIKRAVDLLQNQIPQRADTIAEQAAAAEVAPTESTIDSAASLTDLASSLMDSVHRFDTVKAQQVIKQAFVLYPVEDVCLHMLLPVMADIGEEWQTGQTSLQVEHFTTHMVRQQLLALGATMPSPWRPGRVVAGCAPEDWHEMGILMLSLFLRRRGWEVIFLGQAVGLNRLVDSLDMIKPDVLMLSSGYLNTVINLLGVGETIIEARGDSVWFVYGGTVFEHAPQLVGQLPGVFAGESLLEARDRIDALLSGSWQPEQRAHTQIPPALFEAFTTMKAVELTLTDGMSGLLMQTAPDMPPDEATQQARYIIGAFMAAVRFNLPTLQNSEANIARHLIVQLDVPRGSVEDLLKYYLGTHNMAQLHPFIDALFAAAE